MNSVQQRIDLRGQLCPVRDQGLRSTCSAIATSTAHEHSLQSPVHLSAEYLHWHATNGRVNDPASLTEVANALRYEGQPVESACPYIYSLLRTATWATPSGVQVYKRESRLRMSDLRIVQECLEQGRCPVLGISLPHPFYTPEAPWVIPADGQIRGRHAVLGVGLGDYQGKTAVLIRNCWGADWGDDGHAWLNEEFLDRHLQLVLVLEEEST